MKDQSQNTTLYKYKLPLLSWMVIPILGFWLATNYLIGLNRKIEWKDLNESRYVVLGAQAGEPSIAKSYNWQGNGLITLWFDDVWYSQYSIALPLLDNLGMVGALAVPTNLVSGESYMTWPQIKRTQFKGWEITSHSVNHVCEPDKLNNETIEFELGESLNTLRENGLNIDNFVTPCGVENDQITTSAKEKYLSLRTATEGFNSLPVDDPYSLKIQVVRNTTSLTDVNEWIKEAEKEDKWLILVFHQIGYEGEEYETTPELFNQMVRLVERSDLSVVLPAQALQVSLPEERE